MSKPKKAMCHFLVTDHQFSMVRLNVSVRKNKPCILEMFSRTKKAFFEIEGCYRLTTGGLTSMVIDGTILVDGLRKKLPFAKAYKAQPRMVKQVCDLDPEDIKKLHIQALTFTRPAKA